jgi:micrococcal nuclease
MYEYHAKVVKVVDGDTIDVDVDLGFKITTHQRLRLANIDTPELRSSNIEEREAAKRAKERVEELILGEMVLICTSKTGKYGRYIADVFYWTEDNPMVDLGATLLNEGLTKVYGK